MPTINQLPAAVQASSADELPLSQGGVTRNITVGTLLSSTQPNITLAQQTILGRVSLGAGGPEPVNVGAGLFFANGAIAADGSDQLSYANQPMLTLTDELILNSNGQPSRMPVGKLLGLYQPGANIAISGNGTISATSAASASSSITTDPAATSIAPTDLVGISQAGEDRAIPLASLLAGTDVSSTRIIGTGRSVGSSNADLAARRIDPRDFAVNMFSGATSQDDGIGIQAAIAFAESTGGGIVQLPMAAAVKGQLATPLVIAQSGVSLKGQGRSLLTQDNLGPIASAAVTLRWVGTPGATMLRVAPVSNILTGTPLSGCDLTGFLLDCAGTAATGAYLASLQYSVVDMMVTEATADGVLLDTVDLGEFNDCQNNDLTLGIRILTTTGNCLRLAGTARASKLGNTSYNAFRRVILTHNAGDALVLDYADNNYFDKVLIQNRSSFTTTLGTCGAGRSIVFKGSSEVVARSTGNIALFGANNNVIGQLSCAGPIASLGQQSGYSTPAVENSILHFDIGNNALDLDTETGASIQVSTTDNVDLSLAGSTASFANIPSQAKRLRDERGTEAVAISSTTGDHMQFYATDTKTWGLGIDGTTNDLRFAASVSTAGQLNLGNGQGAYTPGALAIGGRVPAGPLVGGQYVYDIPTGQNPAQPPAGTSVIYSQAGTLRFWTGAGNQGAVGTPFQLRAYPVNAQANDIADCEAARSAESLSVFSFNGQYIALYSGDFTTRWEFGIDPLNNDCRVFPNGGTPGQVNLGNGQGSFVLGAIGIGARLPTGAPSGALYLSDTGTATIPAPNSGLALYVKDGALSAISNTGANVAVGAPGPAWSPPKRLVTASADTPTVADDQGVIAYSNASPVSVTVNDLGSLRVYDTLQLGTGSVSLVPGTGVTMMSQGKSVSSVISAYQGAAISVIGTGTGAVFVVGNTQ